jgi:hypothetical protein
MDHGPPRACISDRDADEVTPAVSGQALGEVPTGATGNARTDPPLCGAAVPAAPALPRRNPGALLAATPGRQVRPRPGPELLRRVLDGLNGL